MLLKKNNEVKTIIKSIAMDLIFLSIQYLLSSQYLPQHYYYFRVLAFGLIMLYLLLFLLYIPGLSIDFVIFINRLLISLLYICLFYVFLPEGIEGTSPPFAVLIIAYIHILAVYIILAKFRSPKISSILGFIIIVESGILTVAKNYPVTTPGLILLFIALMLLSDQLGYRIVIDRVKDSTQTRRIAKLKTQLADYERAYQLQNMTASFVHEVNNPLNHMEGNVFFLKEIIDQLEDLTKTPSLTSGQLNNVLTSVVEELESISRQYEIGFGNIQKHIRRMKRIYLVTRNDQPHLIDAVEVLNDVIVLTVPTHKRHFLTINADGRIDILFKEIDLVSLFSNPIKNALQSLEKSDDPKKILISLKRETTYSSHLKFSVEDSGRGFDFETDSEGMGLGLKICSDICEANGGFMETSNRDIGGALVNIILPLKAGS